MLGERGAVCPSTLRWWQREPSLRKSLFPLCQGRDGPSVVPGRAIAAVPTHRAGNPPVLGASPRSRALWRLQPEALTPGCRARAGKPTGLA